MSRTLISKIIHITIYTIFHDGKISKPFMKSRKLSETTSPSFSSTIKEDKFSRDVGYVYHYN